MSASATFTRTWAVGQYAVTMNLPADPVGMVAISIEWAPRAPTRLTDAELEQYRSGRNRALQAWAAATGRRTMVFDT